MNLIARRLCLKIVFKLVNTRSSSRPRIWFGRCRCVALSSQLFIIFYCHLPPSLFIRPTKLWNFLINFSTRTWLLQFIISKFFFFGFLPFFSDRFDLDLFYSKFFFHLQFSTFFLIIVISIFSTLCVSLRCWNFNHGTCHCKSEIATAICLA